METTQTLMTSLWEAKKSLQNKPEKGPVIFKISDHGALFRFQNVNHDNRRQQPASIIGTRRRKVAQDAARYPTVLLETALDEPNFRSNPNYWKKGRVINEKVQITEHNLIFEK